MHPAIDMDANLNGGGDLLAVAPGTVTAIIQSNPDTAPGYVLIIEHNVGGEKYYSVYFHVKYKVDDNGNMVMDTNLKVGDTVVPGQEVAKIGSTGAGADVHVLYEVRRGGGVYPGGVALDPQRANGYWLSDKSQLSTTWLDISPALGGYDPMYPSSWRQK